MFVGGGGENGVEVGANDDLTAFATSTIPSTTATTVTPDTAIVFVAVPSLTPDWMLILHTTRDILLKLGGNMLNQVSQPIPTPQGED